MRSVLYERQLFLPSTSCCFLRLHTHTNQQANLYISFTQFVFKLFSLHLNKLLKKQSSRFLFRGYLIQILVKLPVNMTEALSQFPQSCTENFKIIDHNHLSSDSCLLIHGDILTRDGHCSSGIGKDMQGSGRGLFYGKCDIP
jgi:hypothetical protein